MSNVESQVEPAQVPVHVAFNRVKAEVGAVGKNRKNEAQGYYFRSIEDFIDAVSPVLARHGVLMLPNIVEHKLFHFERTTNNGKQSTSTVATVTTEWHVIGPMGDSFTFRTVGEGADTADKATNKAMSASFKYAMAQGMAIPLHLDDGDSTDGANEKPARARASSTKAAQSRQERPQAPAATRAQRAPKADTAKAQEPSEAMPLSAAQQRLRDRIGALPDSAQAIVGDYLREQGVSLRRPVDAATLTAVGAFIDALPADA